MLFRNSGSVSAAKVGVYSRFTVFMRKAGVN